MTEPPVLAVLSPDGTCSASTLKLGRAAGARVCCIEVPAEVRGLRGVCGVVVVPGGREREALPLLQALEGDGAPQAVVIGAERDYRLGIALLQAGAHDYFVLPHDLGALRAWILERVASVARVEATRSWAADQRDRFDFSRLIGSSRELRGALRRAERVIPHDAATVLITGETGTGKDLVARAIHFNGPRAARPFVEVNCAALPASLLEAELFGYERGAFTDARTAKPGLFEVANEGTLFLDEIGDLSTELQAKLLKVLEAKRVRRLGSVREVELDVRILAATHVDLQAAMRTGLFRRDLFYRLSVAPLHLPPLRERAEDTVLLAEFFLDQFSEEYGVPRPELTPEIRTAMLTHRWPGNVRELRNSVERAMLFGEGELRVEDLFFGPGSSPTDAALPFPASMREIERAAARAMVERLGGNKTEAAKALGISRKLLYTLLRAGQPDGGEA